MIYKVQTISQMHEFMGISKPLHPLVSLIDYSKIDLSNAPESGKFSCGFYGINYKSHCSMRYGRTDFDHSDGTLLCTAPDQVISYEKADDPTPTGGWGLYFHPDLIRNSALGNQISSYGFFSYEENEALHLSELERDTLINLFKQLEAEYLTNVDSFSQDLIISNISLILNYCRRFYNRQMLTRKNYHSDLLIRFESFVQDWFQNASTDSDQRLLDVQTCAQKMGLSADYLSDLLKCETGKTTQEHIHFQLLEKAKTELLGSEKTVAEIAYQLGFEYPQSFSKLFSKKVGVTPAVFRKS